jgi:hypothetical protein
VGGSPGKTWLPHAPVGADVPRSRAPPRLALLVLRQASARYAVPTRTTRTRDFDFGVILHLFRSWGKHHYWLIQHREEDICLSYQGSRKTNVFSARVSTFSTLYDKSTTNQAEQYDICRTAVFWLSVNVFDLVYLLGVPLWAMVYCIRGQLPLERHGAYIPSIRGCCPGGISRKQGNTDAVMNTTKEYLYLLRHPD